MADEKIINTRILLKYDTLAKWEASTGILRPGEVAIATVPAGSAGKEVGSVATPQVLVKVGDGINTFAKLPYITAKAGDVYAWAKQAHPVYISGVNEETGAPIYKNLSDEILAILGDVDNLKTFQNGNAQVIANAIKEAKDYTNAEIKKLTHVSDGEGNVVTNVTQANGIVTVTKGTLAVGDLEGGQGVLTDITNIKTEIAGVKTTATENFAEAKGYTDAEVKKLADGAVKENADAIAEIKDGTTGILATAKAYTDTEVSNAKTAAATDAQGKADKALADAKDYVDAEIEKIAGDGEGSLGELEKRVAANEAAIGTMPPAGEDGVAPTLVGMIEAAKQEAADAVDAEELRATKAETALGGRLETVEAFFEAALEDGDGQQVIDTLKEIQDYIKADETGAAEMLASIKANTDAIGEMPVGEDGKVNTTLVEMIEAAKTAASEAVAKEETRAKSEEARIEGLANAAQEAADAAQEAADAAQETADDALEAIGAKTDAATVETVYGAIAAEKARAEGKEGELNTAIGHEVTAREAAVNAVKAEIGVDAEGNYVALKGDHTTLIAAINAANDGVSANADEIDDIKEQLAGITGTNGILGQANAYTDGKIQEVNNAVTTLSGQVVKTITGDNYIKVDATDVNNVKLSFDIANIVLVAGDSTNLDPAQA